MVDEAEAAGVDAAPGIAWAEALGWLALAKALFLNEHLTLAVRHV